MLGAQHWFPAPTWLFITITSVPGSPVPSSDLSDTSHEHRAQVHVRAEHSYTLNEIKKNPLEFFKYLNRYGSGGNFRFVRFPLSVIKTISVFVLCHRQKEGEGTWRQRDSSHHPSLVPNFTNSSIYLVLSHKQSCIQGSAKPGSGSPD